MILVTAVLTKDGWEMRESERAVSLGESIVELSEDRIRASLHEMGSGPFACDGPSCGERIEVGEKAQIQLDEKYERLVMLHWKCRIGF